MSDFFSRRIAEVSREKLEGRDSSFPNLGAKRIDPRVFSSLAARSMGMSGVEDEERIRRVFGDGRVGYPNITIQGGEVFFEETEEEGGEVDPRVVGAEAVRRSMRSEGLRTGDARSDYALERVEGTFRSAMNESLDVEGVESGELVIGRDGGLVPAGSREADLEALRSDPWWAKSLRTVGAALEPFTFAQDVFFASLVDIANSMSDEPFEEVSIFENTKKVFSQIGDYAPFGVSPDRIVSGEDIANIVLGIEDEDAQKWVGIALDLIADPLLAGSFLRVSGKALNAAGRAGSGASEAARVTEAASDAARAADAVRDTARAAEVASDAARAADAVRDAARAAESARPGVSTVPAQRAGQVPVDATLGDRLISWGNTFDEAITVGGWWRSLRSSDSRIPALINEAIDSNVANLMSILQNPEATLFGVRSEKIGNVLNWVLNPSTRSRVMFDGAGDAAPTAGVRAGSAARTTGEQIHLHSRMARQYGRDVSQAMQEGLGGLLENVIGLRDTGLLRRLFARLNGTAGVYKRSVDQLPELVQEMMLNRTAYLVDHGGVLASGVRTGRSTFDAHLEGMASFIEGGVDAAGRPLGGRLADVGFDPFESVMVRKDRYRVGTSESGTPELVLVEEAARVPKPRRRVVYDESGVARLEDASEAAARYAPHEVRPAGTADRLLDGTAEINIPNWQTEFDEALEEVLNAARASGITSPEGLEMVGRRFTGLVEEVTRINTTFGVEASGYLYAHERFIEAVGLKLGVTAKEANELWIQTLNARLVSGADFNTIRFVPMAADEVGGASRFGVRFGDEGIAGVVQTREGAVNVGVNTARTGVTESFTVSDVLSGDAFFDSLNMNSFLDSLPQGHLRRSYGLWSGSDGARDFIRGYESGQFIHSSFLPDGVISRVEASRPEVMKDLREYIDTVYRSGPRARNVQAVEGVDASFILRKDNVIRHLTERGVQRGLSRRDAASEASAAWLDLFAHTNRDPNADALITALRDKYDAARASRFRPGGSLEPEAGAFRARQEFTDEWQTLIGELQVPTISLLETSEVAARNLPVRRFMRDVYETGVEAGMVVNRVDPARAHRSASGTVFTRVPDEPSVWGAFAGKDIHPHLYKELTDLMRGGNFTSPALNRLRSIVSGGYLASPNIILTNLIGSIYTSTIGLDAAALPALVSNLIQVLPGMREGNSAWFKRMRESVPVGDLNLVGTTITTRELARLRERLAGVPQGSPDVLRETLAWYEQLLRSPLGAQWAGLDGFQFTDQWVRTAAFKTRYEAALRGGLSGRTVDAMSEAQALSEASRFAMLSTLDYGDLPKALQFGRDTGLVMFPGFSYLIAGRTVNAMLNRPGGLMAYDRLGDAITNSVLDPEERMAVYAGMDEWLKQEGGIPIGYTVDEAGDKHAYVIPFNQLIPTKSFWGAPLVDSLSNAGLLAPIIDLAQAIGSGSGEGPFSARYGRDVFQASSSGLERVGEVGKFLYSSFAPSFARKLFNPVVGPKPDQGFVPAIGGLFMDDEAAGTIYSADELIRSRKSRDFTAEAIGAVLRSVTPVSLSGGLSSVRRMYRSEKFQLDELLRELEQRRKYAVLRNDSREVERTEGLIISAREEFLEKWGRVSELMRVMEREAEERGFGE